MERYGLIGGKLGHSYSPEIHGMLADYEYGLYEFPEEELSDFLSDTDLQGMNVTIPFKKKVLEYASSVSDTASKMGAANLLKRYEDGWHADNTDYYGFMALVKKSGIGIPKAKVLVFGSGGASNTAVKALCDLGADRVVVISRSGEDNYENISRHQDAEILVNTTPLGMYPENGEMPRHPGFFPACRGVIDVVYNPLRTAFVMEAEKLGIPSCGGLYMLVAQAFLSAEIFTEKTIPADAVDDIYLRLRSKVQNIVIIGMPGAGKSSVAMKTAELSGRELIETDELIEKKAGMSIPGIFASFGEAYFRKLETEVIRECGKLSGKVISTGGGCVTREENYPLLHQNGMIFWLKRDISLLPKDGRPVSLSKSATEIYNERKELYARFADEEIENDSAIEAPARMILLKAECSIPAET